MAKTTINNGDAGSVVRAALNAMFTQLFGLVVGKVAGRWYRAVPGTVGAGSALVANSIRFQPFLVLETFTISDLQGRVTTGASGGNVQFAIYAADAATKLPTGAALASTASISVTSTGVVTSDITGADVQLTPGLYWMAVNADATAGGTAVMQASTGNMAWASYLIGSATAGNVNGGASTASLTHTFAQTYNTWPDMTGQVLGESTGSAAADIQFKVASVP